MLADAVVAIVDDTRLSSILPVIHRQGLGHIARVIRAERGDVREQLRRAGIPVEQSPKALADAGRLLLITAAARSSMAADLLLQRGAITVWIVTTAGFWRDIDDRADIVAADPELVVRTVPPPELPSAQDRLPARETPAGSEDSPS